MFNRQNKSQSMPLRKLLAFIAFSTLIPSIQAETTRVARRDNPRLPDTHGLFKNFLSTSSTNRQDMIKLTCPDSKDVENQLNSNWAVNPVQCNTMSSDTFARYYPLPNPFEYMLGSFSVLSCHPKIALANDVELEVVNQTCSVLGLKATIAYIACAYKITLTQDYPAPSGIVIGCPLNQSTWWPKEGYFNLFSTLQNSTTCNVQDGAFLCQRDIPLLPESGSWQPVDGLYPIINNFNTVESTLNYTIGITGDDDSTCCTVELSGFAGYEWTQVDNWYSFKLNVESLNVNIKNKSVVCNSSAVLDKMYQVNNAMWLRLVDLNTQAVFIDDALLVKDVCNFSTKLTRVKTEDTQSTPSTRLRF